MELAAQMRQCWYDALPRDPVSTVGAVTSLRLLVLFHWRLGWQGGSNASALETSMLCRKVALMCSETIQDLVTWMAFHSRHSFDSKISARSQHHAEH